MLDSSVFSTDNAIVRAAIPKDVPKLFELITALAEYERLAHEITGTPAALHQHLFGDQPCIEAIVAEQDGQLIGFALFFINYSTSITQPGIYLEDLFVLPKYRGQKVGKLLLSYLAQLTQSRRYGRLQWSVLDWNEPAIGFYQRIGAEIVDNVRVCRVVGEPLQQLASASSLRFRQATPADTASIFALVKANIAHDGTLDAFNGSMDALAHHLFQQNYAEVLIAEQDAQPVGLALFCTTYSTFLTKPGLFVEDLFVMPEYRGQGIGKGLLAQLAEQVLARDYGRLEWRVRTWNQKAIDFYGKVGATILADWRVCQMHHAAIRQLAAA